MTFALPALRVVIKGGEGSGNFNHSGRPGKIGGSSNSSSLSGGYLPKEQRVWQGKQEGTSTLSKLETGAIGEMVAKNVLSEKFGTSFGTFDMGKNNAPIDVAGDHHAIEVKTGIISNDKTAQRWRATIGQPGKAEAELLKKMTKDEKREYNDYKRQKILERKASALKKMSEIAGQEIKPAVLGVILSPDGKRADAFFIPGFHLKLNWKEYATEDYYLGTYELGAVEKQLNIRLKGGEGSGNFNHSGRPGKVGGSSTRYNFNVYHGSPNLNLTSISANPKNRQYDNATSVFGAFIAIDRQSAQHYAGNSGKVYETNITLNNPEHMSWRDFQYFQDVTKDRDGVSLSPEKWEDRMQELIQEAREYKQLLLDSGKDGIIVSNMKGDIVEIASFEDIQL